MIICTHFIFKKNILTSALWFPFVRKKLVSRCVKSILLKFLFISNFNPNVKEGYWLIQLLIILSCFRCFLYDIGSFFCYNVYSLNTITFDFFYRQKCFVCVHVCVYISLSSAGLILNLRFLTLQCEYKSFKVLMY